MTRIIWILSAVVLSICLGRLNATLIEICVFAVNLIAGLAVGWDAHEREYGPRPVRRDRWWSRRRQPLGIPRDRTVRR